MNFIAVSIEFLFIFLDTMGVGNFMENVMCETFSVVCISLRIQMQFNNTIA